MRKLGTMDLLRVSLRLAFLQATWCEGSMQSEGLAYCLVPGLTRLKDDRDDLNSTLRKYRAPFNTHPYLVGVVAGAILRMEEDGASYKKVTSFLRGTMGPLAAVGDPFFKSALAPTAAVLASLVAILFGALAGVATLLVAFNLLHLMIRITGVFVGYRDGDVALTRVTGWMESRRTRFMKTGAATIGGMFLGFMAFESTSLSSPMIVAITGALTLVLAVGLVGRRSLWVYVAPALLAALFLMEVLS